jgi:nitrate/nitrite transport system substrate-binding protein
MSCTVRHTAEAEPQARPDFNVFHRYAAGFPWRSHAIWLMTQMVRWQQLPAPVRLSEVAEQIYRPDLYRYAAAALGLAAPSRDYKLEGVHGESWRMADGSGPELGPDLFFDGQLFQPADPVGYLRGLPQPRGEVDGLAALARVNPPWSPEQQAELLEIPPAPAVMTRSA